MQRTKTINSPQKSIQIKITSKSRSASKNAEKSQPHQIKQIQKRQNFDQSRTRSPSPKQCKIQKSQYNQISKYSLIFSQDKNKKALKLSVKENNLITSMQNNELNLNPKQKVSWLKTSNQSSLIRHLMQKDFLPCQKEDLKQQVNKQKREPNLELEVIKNDTQKSQPTEKFQPQKKQYKVYDFRTTQNRRQPRQSGQFEIKHQFSLNIISYKSTVDFETQTIEKNHDDKYFIEYMKIRKQKLNSFEVIEAQEAKIKDILKSTIDFSKNYDDLIEAINNGPINDRQKRTYSLGKDLTACQTKLSQAFSKVKLVADKLQQYIEHNVYQINKMKATLFASIQNLVFATLLKLKKQRLSQKATLCERILQRAHNQFKYLKELVVGQSTYITKTVTKFKNQIVEVRDTFSEYMNVHLENRVLLYTLIKQIEKIPALMITIFGEDKELQGNKLKEPQIQYEDRLKDYMSAKCEECYHMKKKINFMQFQNQKIKPVFKSLEWLIRDCTKNQCCLSML